MGIHKAFRKSFINLMGWKTNKRYVLFESDDWGSVRIKNKDVFNFLTNKGLDLYKSRYTKFDRIEHPTDLDELFSILHSHKDHKGNSPIFTANFLVANPDFKLCKEGDFKEYKYKTLIETYEEYGILNEMQRLLFDGIDQGFWFPQYHGKEHLQPIRWLKCVNNNEYERLAAESDSLPGIPLDKSKGKYTRYNAAFDFWSIEEQEDVNYNALKGLELFKETFGFEPVSFAPSQSVVGIEILKKLSNNGIRLNKAGAHFLPRLISNQRKMKQEFWGYNVDYSMFVSRSNANFEPSSGSIDWVDECLWEISNAFLFKKPAVISTHRVNYIGGLNQKNRDDSLRKLNKLLTELLRKFPDVEFVHSAQLARIMIESNGW